MKKKIRELIISKILEIEQRPTLPENCAVEDCKFFKYIVDRDLDEYIKYMPELSFYLQKDISVLEIGAGKGIAAQQLSEKYNCRVTATGLTPPKFANLEFKIATAKQLPFPDRSFDLVLSMHGISWEPDQKKALREVVRVLKPGGTAHIYLITFRHSVALFYGNDFWNMLPINLEEIKKYEYFPLLKLKGVRSKVVENQFPLELCDGHFREWYLLIHKPKK